MNSSGVSSFLLLRNFNLAIRGPFKRFDSNTPLDWMSGLTDLFSPLRAKLANSIRDFMSSA